MYSYIYTSNAHVHVFSTSLLSIDVTENLTSNFDMRQHSLGQGSLVVVAVAA